MPETQYDVQARLTIQARQAHGEARKLSQELKELGHEVAGATHGVNGLLHHVLALGGAYLGLHAVGHVFRELGGEAIRYAGNLQKTKIGLQSIIGAVEGGSWDQAGKKADYAFQKIRDMALELPVTSEQMFGIFQGIVGPIEGAGFGMQKVLEITRKTTLAASVLNVDFTEASRDITMMARGAAGMHVKLFSLLHATGAIKEDAQAFNALSQHERIEKLDAALQKFSSNGSAFAKSWAGVTTTFKDVYENFATAAASPIMQRIASNLDRFNHYLLEHRHQIEAFMRSVGNDVAFRLQALFDRAEKGFTYVLDHWDAIHAKFTAVVDKVREVTPHLLKAAAAWQAVQLGRVVAGGAIGLAGNAAGVHEAIQGLGAGATAAGAVGVGHTLRDATSSYGGAAREITEEELVAGAGGAGRNFSHLGVEEAFMANSFTAGGGETAAGGGMALAAGSGLALVATALAAVAGIALVFADNWEVLGKMFASEGSRLVVMLKDFGLALWKIMGPVLKIFGGGLLTVGLVLWEGLRVAFEATLLVLTPLLDIIGSVASALGDVLKPAFESTFGVIGRFAKYMDDKFGELKDYQEYKKEWARVHQKGEPTDYDFKPLMGPALFSPSEQKAMGLDLNKSTVHVTNDFRGSSIQVRQDFKGQTDPDRVVLAMMRDLTRQAESRISSGYAPALSR